MKLNKERMKFKPALIPNNLNHLSIFLAMSFFMQNPRVNSNLNDDSNNNDAPFKYLEELKGVKIR